MSILGTLSCQNFTRTTQETVEDVLAFIQMLWDKSAIIKKISNM